MTKYNSENIDKGENLESTVKRTRDYNKANFRQRAGRKRSGIRRSIAKYKCAKKPSCPIGHP